jgi:hypothetical protein
MKPSEIIKEKANEIASRLSRQWLNPTNEDEWNALMQYLDDERDRVNAVLHKLVSAGYDQSYADAQTANYLHSMIDGTLSEPSEGELK